MSESLLEALVKYMAACPLLAGAVVKAGWLPERAGPPGVVHVSLEAEAGSGVARRYTGGRSLREYHFVLRRMGQFGPDGGSTLKEIAEVEALAGWMAEMAAAGVLPALPEGAEAVWLAARDSAVMERAGAGGTVYRLPCVLRYLQ